MHEYEFRLVVEHSSPLLPVLQSLPFHVQQQTVYYAKPHFRHKNGQFEKKCVESTRAVYHDTSWFRWIHSIETPFRCWSHATYLSFLHIFNYQNPFVIETRHVIQIDSQTQLYTFQTASRTYKLVFEWEYGTFAKPMTHLNVTRLLDSLTRYKNIYGLLRQYPAPLYTLNEQLFRKSVACVEEIPDGKNYLYAHKLDGVFGLVYSYRNKIKEKWEGYECVVREQTTLGDGLVFAAEKMENGDVYLLDVYQVRGHDTASWCKRAVLTHFLPELKLLEGYRIQRYVSNKNDLGNSNPHLKTDGVIIHDVIKDVIYKFKTSQSIDLVHYQGYFYLPDGRIKCLQEGLEEGSVYEISTTDGSVLRKRTDRFKGNSSVQLENILKKGWYDPKIEPLPVTPVKKAKEKTTTKL